MKSTSQKMKTALKQISEEVRSLSDDQFFAMLDAREIGDVGHFYLDTLNRAQDCSSNIGEVTAQATWIGVENTYLYTFSTPQVSYETIGTPIANGVYTSNGLESKDLGTLFEQIVANIPGNKIITSPDDSGFGSGSMAA